MMVSVDEPQHSVWFGSRIGRSLLSLLASSSLSLCHPAVPAQLHGQLDRGVTRLRFCWVTFFGHFCSPDRAVFPPCLLRGSTKS